MPQQSQHRVYIPTNARANQYILAEFKPSDDLYNCFSDVNAAHQRIARALFAQCDEMELHNVHMLINDKLPIIRFHEEAYHLETAEQMLFFYNPRYHEAHSVHGDTQEKARKIRLLFLATGEDLRANAAHFHKAVANVLSHLQSHTLQEKHAITIRDHQHLTYDLYARAKGHKQSYGYKLRALGSRYGARGCELPSHKDLTYVRFTLPLTRSIKTYILENEQQDYAYLYQRIEDAFLTACAAKNLPCNAMIGNGSTPVIRHRDSLEQVHTKELEKISFDPHSSDPQSYVHYDSNTLVPSIDFVIAARAQDEHDMGFGRFMNQVETVIKSVCQSLHVPPERQDINTRFYQHLSYTLEI